VKIPLIAVRALPILAAGGIWLLSAEPSLSVIPPLIPNQDKIFHFIEFGAFGATLWLNRGISRRGLMPLFAIAALWAGTDEIHQSFVPGRDCSVLDFAADLTGAAASLAALSAGERKRRRALAGGEGPTL